MTTPDYSHHMTTEDRLRIALMDVIIWLEAEAKYPRPDPRPAMRLQAQYARAALGMEADLSMPPPGEATVDMRICKLHGVPQDHPDHQYRYPDCERAGFWPEGTSPEYLADLLMDLRMSGPADNDWTYQQTMRHYADLILTRLTEFTT